MWVLNCKITPPPPPTKKKERNKERKKEGLYLGIIPDKET
jgi:hypothetical protein